MNHLLPYHQTKSCNRWYRPHSFMNSVSSTETPAQAPKTNKKKTTTNNSNLGVKLCVTEPDWIMRWFVWKRCVTARGFLVLILLQPGKGRIDGLDEAVLRNSVRFKVKSWLHSNFSTPAAVGFTARLHIPWWKSTKSEGFVCDVNSGSLLLAFISFVEMKPVASSQIYMFGEFLLVEKFKSQWKEGLQKTWANRPLVAHWCKV